MRLKGGKVLLDLTGYDITDDINITLNDEVIKAIVEKGICCLLKIDSHLIAYEPHIKIINNTVINYYDIDLGETTYQVFLSLSSKSFNIVED